MAWTSGFFNSDNGDRPYSADQISEMLEGVISNGVFESVGKKLAVEPNNGMTIQINTGRGKFGKRWVKNDSIYLIQLDESDVTLNRYAAVCVRVDNADSGRTALPYVKYSEFATSPTKPTMERTETIEEYCLGMVLIRGGTNEITAADIEDTRPNTELCGWVTGLIEQLDSDTLWAQWEALFLAWFDSMKDQLSEDAAGNLQNQIDDLKIATETAQAAVDNAWSLQGGTAIVENADLNTYTTPGNYTCSSSNTAATLTNAPITKVTFTLKVYDSTGSGVRLIQEFIPSSLDYVDIYPNRYVRSYYNGSWTAWDKIPYMSQVMPKSGGTFTGMVGYDTSHSGVVKNTQYSFRNIAIYSGSTAVASGNIRMVRK